MQIIDGAHSGRRIWERLNVVNANKIAEEIARSQLNGIKAACNIDKLDNSFCEYFFEIYLIFSLTGLCKSAKSFNIKLKINAMGFLIRFSV